MHLYAYLSVNFASFWGKINVLCIIEIIFFTRPNPQVFYKYQFQHPIQIRHL